MRFLFNFLFLIITLSFFITPDLALAHGGGHEKAKAAIVPGQKSVAVMDTVTENNEAAFEGSIYDEGPEAPATTDLGEYDLGEEEPSPIHSDSGHSTEDIATTGSHEGMDMSGSEHGEKHDMAEVELASHEWVSQSRKGYSAAMGITILAGLAFGFLTLKRPFE